MKIDRIAPDLSGYDLIFIPGGFGTRQLVNVPEFVDWLKSAKDVKHKVSVCTGSLLLGAADFLREKRATTHPNAYDLLRPYCVEVITERIVKDGNVITGGGVATSVDLGLYLCETLAGPEAAQRIQKQMDYPYYQTGM